MTFKAAKCPSCAGDLQVPDDRDTVKCMYCGNDIVVREAIQLAGGVNIENLLVLAKNAEKTGKYDEAYKYYSKVLEYDTNNVEAWIGKGFSPWRSITGIPDIECFRTAIERASMEGKQQEVKQNIVQTIVKRTLDLWGHLNNAQNIYDCILRPGVLPNVCRVLSIIHEFDPNNDVGLVSVGFENLLGNKFTEALEYFKNALSVTTHKAILSEIIILRLTEYRHLVTETSQQHHVIEFLEKTRPGSGKSFRFSTSGEKNKCFIATAAYNSPKAYEVEILRNFRDKHLLTNPLGNAFIKLYYHLSPSVAEIISGSEFLKALTRQILNPIVAIVKVNNTGDKR